MVAAGGTHEICINGTLGVMAVLSAAACVALGPFMAAAYGKSDPSQCTIDEWCGQAVSLAGLPYAAWCDSPWRWLVLVGASFVAFRVFDIIKPPPVRQMEKLRAGWGVLCDDIAAGIYANVVCQILFRVVFSR